MPGRASLAAIAGAVLAGISAAAALAAAPANDNPQTPGVFAPYAAAGGKPTELDAVVDMSEAHPDAGVPACFGKRSFRRTVWYRIPEVAAPSQITVEATGPTLNVIDLAAFVQPAVAVAPAPTPPPATPTPAPTAESRAAPVAYAAATNYRHANVCDGVGAGGSDSTEEPTSAISLLVPPNRPVLIQVGRREKVTSVPAETTFLSLTDVTSTFLGTPRGDIAEPNTRRVPDGDSIVPLTGATITDEDPALPVCPSLGTVWRRYVPDKTGLRRITVNSQDATTLAVFSGGKPTMDNALDCVNRSQHGAMEMVVPVKRHKTLWVRIGADLTFGDESADLNISDGTGIKVVDGGPGGEDPTQGGPGGGFPAYCNESAGEDATVTGTGLGGSKAGYTSASIPLTLDVQGSPLCDVQLTVVGPHGRTYATAHDISLPVGRRTIHVARTTTFTKGRYHLKITALSGEGKPVKVHTAVSGRLTK